MSYNNQEINYKEEYRTTKRKLKTLIYENEFFQEELRKAQRSLLRVQRDKSFLLDRILLYQQGPESSSDSEETEDSDNENTKDSSAKRKRVPATEGSNSFPSSTTACGSSTGKGISSNKRKKTHSTSNSFINNHESTPKNFVKNTVPSSPHSNLITKKTQKFKGNQHYNVVPSSSGILSSHGINATLNSINDVPMSREEIERTLAARQPISDFPTTVSLTLPHQLFSDNLLEGDFIYNDIDGSPSNLDDDVSIDNYD